MDTGHERRRWQRRFEAKLRLACRPLSGIIGSAAKAQTADVQKNLAGVQSKPGPPCKNKRPEDTLTRNS